MSWKLSIRYLEVQDQAIQIRLEVEAGAVEVEDEEEVADRCLSNLL
jgi:hypothetical protein